MSYAWGDKTEAGREREAIVDRLCADARRDGITILRDKEVLDVGDNISKFMQRIGRGDRIFVVLSEKYLKSEYCMFELHEIWRNCLQERDILLNRLKMFALPDAKIWEIKDRALCAKHWDDKFKKLQPLQDYLGDEDRRRLRLMKFFALQVGDILATIAGSVQAQTFDEFKTHGFRDPPLAHPSGTD